MFAQTGLSSMNRKGGESRREFGGLGGPQSPGKQARIASSPNECFTAPVKLYISAVLREYHTVFQLSHIASHTP